MLLLRLELAATFDVKSSQFEVYAKMPRLGRDALENELKHSQRLDDHLQSIFHMSP